MPNHMDRHYTIITKCITDGRLVLFLGAGANLCGRPHGTTWGRGTYLPSGRELADTLATSFAFPKRAVTLHCPECTTELKLYCPSCEKEVHILEEAQDLLRIAQYVTNDSGLGALYGDLHKVFDANYPPTPLHGFLAALPADLEKKGYPHGLLVVTTNYDDLMERAFQEAKQPFDVVTYVAQGPHRGRFLHRPPEGMPKLIDKPNEFEDLSLEQRPVILKIHGAVNRIDWREDSYVIAEDDYIDYLARTTDIANVLPAALLSKLKESNLLFLGYSLSDWNLRVILHRIWSARAFDFKSWAIQLNPQLIDQQFWSKREVDIVNVPLDDYVAELKRRIASLKTVRALIPA
jgi:SIR2-like domain